MPNKLLIAIVCLMWLTACGSIPTQTVQTTHLNFAIPSYRQTSETNQRQDTRWTQTGSLFVEYSNIDDDHDFENFVQANINTTRQNLGTQLEDDIITTTIDAQCSGSTLTGTMISFAVHQNEDVLYLSQIFTIYQKDITVISVASASNNIRSETANSISKSITCRP